MSINRRMDKVWYIYTMEYYSAIKWNETGSFVETWMDLETVIQNELSQKEKNKYHILMHICGIQKDGIDESVCKAEIETDVENKRMYAKGGNVCVINWDIGIDIYTLIRMKQITNENLLYSTGNSTQ